MKLYKIIFILFILFQSCQKVGNGYIKGTVYETGTDVPMKNAMIRVSRTWHAGNPLVVGYTTTDENGKYKIDYLHKQGYSFFINAMNWVDGSEDERIINKKTAKNFSFTPPAFLKLYANKTSSSDNYLMIKGYVILNDTYYSPKTASPYNVLIHAKYGQTIYSNWPADSPCFYMKSNTNYSISWQVYDMLGPTTTKGQAQFNANRGDTVSYTINFN